jgi:pilus assembly protein Flp/PilA
LYTFRAVRFGFNLALDRGADRSDAPQNQFRTEDKQPMSALSKAYIRVREDKGQTMAEYGLIVALVAVVTVAAWTLLGGNITATINSIAGSI